MSIELMLDQIISNLFSDTRKKMNSAKKDLFSKIRDDKIYLYQGSLQDYSRKKIIADTKNTLGTHYLIEKRKLRKYFGGLLSIIIDEADIRNRKNQFIYDIKNCNREHKIQCYRKK